MWRRNHFAPGEALSERAAYDPKAIHFVVEGIDIGTSLPVLASGEAVALVDRRPQR